MNIVKSAKVTKRIVIAPKPMTERQRYRIEDEITAIEDRMRRDDETFEDGFRLKALKRRLERGMIAVRMHEAGLVLIINEVQS